MEVVSTLNLVISKAEKITTVCNFQTMPINSFFVPHNLIRGQIRTYDYMQV